MKRFCSICFLIMMAFSAVFAQKLTYGGKPQGGAKTASTESHFVKFASGIEVYKVRDTSGDDRRDYFDIRKQGVSLGTIEADINAFGGTTDNFFAFYGDLDKNKSKELIVVDFNGSSNGLGVNYYTISIFPDFETKGYTTPLTFNDSEFGKDGTFVYDAKTNETLILQTEWGGIEINDAKRPGGMYFTGRFFRYKNGKLKPATDKPILARRYLNSFQNERFRTDNDPRRPYLWLTSPAAIKVSADPVFAVKPAVSQSGVIEKFENLTETYKTEDNENKTFSVQQIVVRFDSGNSKTIILSTSAPYPVPDEENKIRPETFGILPAKLTLPNDFSPAIVFEKFEGKKVQLNSYVMEAGSDPVYKFWFVE